MATELSPKPDLKADGLNSRIAVKRALLTRLIAFFAIAFAVSLTGCGSDESVVDTAAAPTTAEPETPITDTEASENTAPTPVIHSEVTTDPSPESDASASPDDGNHGWTILFRASDPNLWNSDSDNEGAFSIALDDSAVDFRWLRMRRIDTNEAAIIPLTRDNLLKLTELDDGVFWNGTGRQVTSNGRTHRKLGIATRAFSRRYKSKGVLILNPPRVSGSGWSGWGFGKIALIHSPQYFAWAGERIPETVFEISVTNGDLSTEEKAELVVPKYGLSAFSKATTETTTKVDPPPPQTSKPTPDEKSVPNSNTTTAAAKQQQPVPNAPTLKTATTGVRSLFEQDYENATNQQAESVLAGKLLAQSRIDTNNEATIYALLAESRDLATSAGDAQTALAAVDEMARRFDIDSVAEKMAALNRAASKAKLPIAHRRAAEAALPVIYEAVAAGNFDSAVRLASVARTGARKGRALDLTEIFKAVSDEITQFKADHEAAELAKVALKQNPDAPTEHLTVGAFQCLTEGNWQEGLIHLSRSEDDMLKEIADLELTKPATPQAKVEIANLWMEWIKQIRRRPFDRFRMAAEFWYRGALPELTGAERTNVEKRLQQIGTMTWTRDTPNSNALSVTLPDLSISSSKVPTPWTVLFRSSNPADWDPVNAPEYMKYLRIARADAGDFVIIELSIENLRTITEGTIMWNGRNLLHTGARRLGIASSQWYHGYTKGNQIVPKSDHKDGYGGWGFGRPCAVHGDQVFLWFDKRIPETVFEISVSPGPLHVSEKRQLLISRPIAVN